MNGRVSSSSPIDAKLFDYVCTFTRDAVNLILGDWTSLSSHGMYVPKVWRYDPGLMSSKVERPNWSHILHLATTGLQALPSRAALVEYLLTSPRAVDHAKTILSQLEGFHQLSLTSYFNNHIIVQFLDVYFGSLESPAFDEDRFAFVYQYWEERLLSDKHTIVTKALLQAFMGPPEPVEFGMGATLRRARDQDFEEILNVLGEHALTSEEFHVGQSLVEVVTKVPKLSGNHSEEALQVINDVLAALRLTLSGGVHCKTVVFQRKGHTKETTSVALPHPGSVSRPFLLDEPPFVEESRQVYAGLRKTKKPAGLLEAVRRFNLAYERHRPEERLLDLVVCLEAMYVPDSNAGEIAYKLRNRATALLKGPASLDEKRRMFRLIKAAYHARSVAYHGRGNVALKPFRGLGFGNLEQVCEEIEGYCRASIVRLLNDGSLYSAERLDDVVLKLGCASN